MRAPLGAPEAHAPRGPLSKLRAVSISEGGSSLGLIAARNRAGVTRRRDSVAPGGCSARGPGAPPAEQSPAIASARGVEGVCRARFAAAQGSGFALKVPFAFRLI